MIHYQDDVLAHRVLASFRLALTREIPQPRLRRGWAASMNRARMPWCSCPNRSTRSPHRVVRRAATETLCPILGNVKIAQILAQAGLHLGQTTVGDEKVAECEAAL